MGKIQEAMSKYATVVRQSEASRRPERVALNESDLIALANYDRETGHLVRYDRATGQIDTEGIERLRRRGSIQRLLENRLIYPGGQLTHLGKAEAKRLEGALGMKRAKPPAPPKAAGLPPRAEPAAAGGGLTAQPRVVEAVKPAAAAAVLPGDFLSAFEARPGDLPHDAPSSVAAPRALPAKPAATGLRRAFDPTAVDRTLVALTKPRSIEAEQFKILRTNILYPVSGQPPRSILITSAAPGEGKSFAAANLAVSIALNVNRYVLLIDADLRRPDLHRRFGLGDVPGLGDYLAEGTPLPSLLQKTPVEKLTLLPAGRPPANPSELISSERMAHLMAEVCSRYSDRLIVVDAPPLAVAAESGVLARQVEGILVVVRYGKTRQDEVMNLLARVEEEKLLGCFLNGVDRSASRYYGYYDSNGDGRPRS